MSLAIVSVLFVTAVLAWGMWRLCKTVDRMDREPRYLRRVLRGGALFYSLGAVIGILKVVTGNAPWWSLAFLPIPLFIVWTCLRAASKVNVQN